LKNKIFITGYYGFGNTGDEAILTAMLEHLRELRQDLQITVTSATPAKTAATYGVESILWSDASAMLETVRQTDLVIIGGGGIFHDYWGFNPNTFLTDNHWGISFYTAPAVMATIYEKPVMLYAIGVGPLLSEHGRRFTKVACDAAAAITVRDKASRELLESIGVPAEQITLTVDPVFGFSTEKDPAALAVLQNLNVARPLIGVALRHWDVGIHPGFWEQEVADGLDLFLQNHEGSILFVPFQRLEGKVEDDATIANRIRTLMKRQDRTMVLEPEFSPRQIYTILGQCDLVAGMRLHSLILSILSRVPVLALSYDTKVNQAMERAGLQEFELNIRSVEASRLAELMNRALAAKKESNTEGLADLARQNARIAIEMLDRAVAVSIFKPDLAALLGRGIQAQLRDSQELRAETKRLLHETEFYQKESASHAAQVETLSARITELETERNGTQSELERLIEIQKTIPINEAAWQRERQELAGRTKELALQLAQLNYEKGRLEQEIVRLHDEESRRQQAVQAESNRQSEALRESNAQIQSLENEVYRQRTLYADVSSRLHKAEELRGNVLKGIDRFQSTLDSNLEAYRSQRAWRIMLAIRKGYTLLTRRGTFAFLRWVLALPFAGAGSLDEYELSFPYIWNYMPERMETPLDLPPASSHDPARPVVPTNLPTPAATAKPKKLAELIPERKFDIVILAIFDFEFRFQRPQQIAAQFARRGHRVFWVSPARFLLPGTPNAYEAIPLRENIWEVHLRGYRPDLYGGQMTAEEAESHTRCFEKLYNDFQIAESCGLLQFPYWRQAGLALRDRFGARVLYDCMDDWQNWTAEPRISEFNLAEERQLAKECDVLVVTSQEFYERQQAAGLKPILARNGADFDFFASPRPNDLLKDLPKPIVGYYGAIADWFDLDLLTKVAESRPQYTFVLIGQVHQVDISRLHSLPNVHLLGEKNYREIPLFLSHFDVCLIPFKLNNLTKGVDPVKLYEYFSQGKPVVATDMAELPHNSNLLYIAKDPEDFARKVDAALQENDPQQKQRRIDFARGNTWTARVDAMEQAVSDSFPLVSILIVTYNSEEFIEPCLESIARNGSWPNYEVIIVDNKSTDKTPEILERHAKTDTHIRLECHPKNLGFAGGNNLAAQRAKGDYLVFLNPDTIVTPGWLGRMVRHCEVDAKAGAVAAVTNFSGNETKINFDYGNVLEMEKFALRIAAEKAGQASEILVAPLYCVLTPRPVWEKAGGELDAGFQIGMFEDDDFSLRIQKAGYRVIAADDCFIHHFGNGSFSKISSEESLRIFEQNKKRFESKWGASWHPHKLRPGVRPPYEEPRFTPGEFLSINGTTPRQQSKSLELTRLHPARTEVQRAFNIQSDGQSALVVECANATPGTVIVMGLTMLQTSYGNPTMLSALVPPELYAIAGSHPVYLLNDFGESNRMEFKIEAHSRTAVSV
jgi:polysaccharide pyruvyl transferase CsaB